MTVRIGIDVGGTFTKAVACDIATGDVVCRALVPTTHPGVDEGIVHVLQDISVQIRTLGVGPVALVAHSTTQAVNALLEGDTAVVGVLGLGRPPDLRKADKRTRVGEIKLAPSKTLRTRHAFLDSSKATKEDVEQAMRSLVDQGATALCISEAFAVDDDSMERLALTTAQELGVPACAGHELTGLYGLELRTVTAAINASILPVTLATAQTVERVVSRTFPRTSVAVMRGDGGAADVETMRQRPLLTAFSGPAASVSGALRHLSLRDAVVIEVGGTSTNVSVVRGGRPVLSYVRVLDHTTAVRSLDVRVTGVAGGSMIRVAKQIGRMRKLRIAGVGSRSAHIAGLEYCSFDHGHNLADAKAELVSPLPGDPPEYVVVTTSSGVRIAPTVTCAANALGLVPEQAYAQGDPIAARRGFEALGRLLDADWRDLARQTLEVAASNVATLVHAMVKEHSLQQPAIVGVGGGAGALVPEVARELGLEWHIPPDAEVISSVGDALSLIRLEIERGMPNTTGEEVARLVADIEEAAALAGADPETLQVETEAVPERGAVRAVALGAVALKDATHEHDVSDETLRSFACETLGHNDIDHVASTASYTVFTSPSHGAKRFVLLDRRGTVVASGEGLVLTGTGTELASTLSDDLASLTRHLGPFTVAPAIRIVRERRVIDLSLVSSPSHAIEAAVRECSLGNGHPVVALVSRN